MPNASGLRVKADKAWHERPVAALRRLALLALGLWGLGAAVLRAVLPMGAQQGSMIGASVCQQSVLNSLIPPQIERVTGMDDGAGHYLGLRRDLRLGL